MTCRLDVCTKRKCDSEFSEIKFVAGNSEVFDDVCNNAPWHVARMPREGDDAVRAERIRIVAMAAGIAKMFAANLAESTLQLPAVVRRVLACPTQNPSRHAAFAHRSGCEDKSVAEGRRNRAPSLQQCFQMDFGGLLKAEKGFAPVASVSMTAGQEAGFGNPHAVFIPSESHL